VKNAITAGNLVQMVEQLPSKHEALSSNSSTTPETKYAVTNNHSFNKKLLGFYYVPGTILDAGNTVVSSNPSWSLCSRQ
jgi:hypothetical protein